MKKPCSIPISEDVWKIVKQKQIELTTKRNKALTLTEVSNEIIKNGLKVMEDNKIETIVLVKGNPTQLKVSEGFKLGKDGGTMNEIKNCFMNINKTLEKIEREITIQDMRDELYNYNSFLAKEEREIRNMRR